ncbi:MAG TPA: hypothetical protein VG326_13595 [Tepidisphaeraceae bacterium]|jgi:hypothetical protein|nr:hypothetical protein [Tepidisphaeraceae bacterium]
MEGITTVIVAFIFACIAFPHLVKSRVQFNAALGLALLIILINSVGAAVASPGLLGFTHFVNGLLQVTAILLLVMSTGGRSLSDLKGDMTETIEMVRRGGERQEVIVPLKGEQPKERVREPAAIPRKTPRASQDSSIPLD